MPMVLGILAFVYSGHGVFPSVRASMKQPEHFPKGGGSSALLKLPETHQPFGTRCSRSCSYLGSHHHDQVIRLTVMKR